VDGPAELEALVLAQEERGEPRPSVLAAIGDALACVPDRARKTLGHFGPVPHARLSAAADRFARLVAIDLAVAHGAAPRVHVVLALESILGRTTVEVDRTLRAILERLVDGGLLVATFPAAARIGGPVALPLLGDAERPRQRRFHEVELQYRLRCAGFGGVHLRRFRSEHERPGILLCRAARRVEN
jgi:hypothetical protein